MHKVMFKVSICLLLVSAIIYACGEYTHTKSEIDKLKTLESLSKVKLVKQALEKPPQKQVPVELPSQEKLQLEVEERKFSKISGLTAPSDSNVNAGLLAELKSEKLIWAKNPLEKVPIASLSKVMTVLVVLDELEKREDVDLKMKIKITSTARSTRYSSFLRKHPLPEVTVEECLQSAIIKSANDSCALLAEFFGEGDQTRFVAMMNSKARELGMSDTAFFNPHGLPGDYFEPVTPDNSSTMNDLLTLVIELYENRREVFQWSRLKSLTLPRNHKRGVLINNTNPLIAVNGVVGLKTGFTNDAGWCLISVDTYGGKVYVGIITGCPSKTVRNSFARSLLLWGRKAGKILIK